VPCKRQVLNGHPLFSLFLTNDSVDIGYLSITHSASTVVYFWHQRVSNTSKQMYSTANCIYFTIFSIFMCVRVMMGATKISYRGAGETKFACSASFIEEVAKSVLFKIEEEHLLKKFIFFFPCLIFLVSSSNYY